jgi:hypothetical protein
MAQIPEATVSNQEAFDTNLDAERQKLKLLASG